MLTTHERDKLRQISRQLTRDDPRLARMLTAPNARRTHLRRRRRRRLAALTLALTLCAVLATALALAI